MAVLRLDEVDTGTLAVIARDVFGGRTEIRHSRLLSGGVGNLAYLVSLAGHDQRYVFRFNRGFREDVYQREVENYALVTAATGVRGPEIITVDRSQRLIPASFMVMEYLAGQAWTELCRPGNPDVSPVQRDAIRASAGAFFADLHAMRRPATGDECIFPLVQGLSGFATAVEAGYLDLDLERVAACERAIRADPAVHTPTLSLCMSDGEIYFDKRNGAHELAFVLDLEWIAFGNRVADLSRHVVPGMELVALDRPVAVAADDLRRDPFFRDYGARIRVDHDALTRVARYTQLSTWGHVAGEDAPAEKKQWIRDAILPLIHELIELVAGDDGIR